MSELSAPSASMVLQLRVVLRGISPLIWRRLLVRCDATIADLQVTLQLALGWTDEHRPHERFLYEYDFTDGWQHDVRVERLLPIGAWTDLPGLRGRPTRRPAGGLRWSLGLPRAAPAVLAGDHRQTAGALRSKREGWFEVIAGKSMPAEGPARCFSFVQTYDTRPKRRLFELLKSQGMQANLQITFLTDGGEDVRELPLYLNPQAEHVLDWFHLAMRLTVMGQMAKGLGSGGRGDLASEAARQLQRLKCCLWHGNLFRALQVVEDLEEDLQNEGAGPEQRKLLRAIREFDGYMRQWGLDPELRRTPSQRGNDLERLCRIDDQPGRQQAHGEAAADALDTARGTPAAPGPHTGAQRRAHGRLPPLVSEVRSHGRQPGAGGVTSHTLSRSPAELPTIPSRGRWYAAFDIFHDVFDGPTSPLGPNGSLSNTPLPALAGPAAGNVVMASFIAAIALLGVGVSVVTAGSITAGRMAAGALAAGRWGRVAVAGGLFGLITLSGVAEISVVATVFSNATPVREVLLLVAAHNGPLKLLQDPFAQIVFLSALGSALLGLTLAPTSDDLDMRLVVRVAGRPAGVAALGMTGALVATLIWAIAFGSGQLLGTLPLDAVDWREMLLALGGMAVASVVALGSVWRAFSLNWRNLRARLVGREG